MGALKSHPDLEGRWEKEKEETKNGGARNRKEEGIFLEGPSGSKLRAGGLETGTGTISLREVTLTSFFYGESKRKDERNREKRGRQRRGGGGEGVRDGFQNLSPEAVPCLPA